MPLIQPLTNAIRLRFDPMRLVSVSRAVFIKHQLHLDLLLSSQNGSAEDLHVKFYANELCN